MEKKHIEYIDIIKAICIFFVVVEHSKFPCQIEKQWLNSFVAPTFFAATGLTYSMKSHAKRGFLTVDFVVKKLKRLMLPYFIWSFGYLFVSFMIRRSFSVKGILMVLYGSFWSLVKTNTLSKASVALWFLPCMFLAVCFAELIFQLLYKCFKNEHRRNIATAAAAVILSVISFVLPRLALGYPWCVDIAIMATAFILIGYLFRQVINRVEKLKNEDTLTWLLIFIATSVLVALTFKLNVNLTGISHVSMADSIYGIYSIFMLDAVVGIVMTTAASVLLSKLKYHGVLTYVGQSSFVIFLIHYPLVKLIRKAVLALGFNHWIWSIVAAIITIIIICPIASMINKYIPEIAGGSRSKK